MALSIVRVTSLTTNTLKVLFTDDLDENIGVGNVTVTSEFNNIPDVVVSSVSVIDETITVKFRPLFPGVKYKVTFKSTASQSFQGANGEILYEDGDRNVVFITSPGEVESNIRDRMIKLMQKAEVYEVDEPTLIRDYVSGMAGTLQRAANDIETVRAGNYISVTVEDEGKTRGSGPIDRLNNGGAFEIVRVGATPSSDPRYGELLFNAERKAKFAANSSDIINPIIENFPSDPISLQSEDVVLERVTDDTDEENYFDGLTINVAKGQVIQLISLSLVRNGQRIPYNIEEFGYALKSNRYDTTLGAINVNLTNKQIELSATSITGESDGFVTPRPGDVVYVSYVYKNLRKNFQTGTATVSTNKQSIRELVPALVNSFDLNYAPIVFANGNIATVSGVSFLNSNSINGNLPYTVEHPAFTDEISYDESNYPSRPGEYSVNYNTGQVYVFGETLDNDGTGTSPPVATYRYKSIYTNGVDYTLNIDTDEVSFKSTRDGAGNEGRIEFRYSETYAAGEDYKIRSHVEVLNERVNNKLYGTWGVEAGNFPITDVFRIFNETTGEIYVVDRFNDTHIYFNGRQAPRQVDIARERVGFEIVAQETLLINDELTNSSGLRIFKINLANSGITDSQRRFVGAAYDTSISFSDSDVFVYERFYEDRLFTSVTININRLQSVGEYMVDYNNGIIYVAVSSSQGTSIGDVSYEHKDVVTKKPHILSVNNIYRSYSSIEDNVTNYRIGSIADTTADIANLEQTGERFINNNPTRPILVGSYQSGEDGSTTAGEDLFTSYSAVFTANDVGRTLRIGSSNKPPSQDVDIVAIINTHQVLVTPAITDSKDGRVWNILDLSSGADKKITLNNNIRSVQEIYDVTQLGTEIVDDLDGYWDSTQDSFTGNVITLSDSSQLQIGDAVCVVYNPGDLYIDYKYLQDEILITYEYGDNSLDWSASNALNPGDEYYVTYKYGALRQSLLSNFGSLTQVPLLTNFPINLNREVYRSIVGGTLQSFITGPTIPAIKKLVESFTDVTPEITESLSVDWFLGNDNLALRPAKTKITPTFDLGKFDDGINIGSGQTLEIPAISHFKLEEGTLEAWVRPSWRGLSNDATLTFNLSMDGSSSVSNVYIGASAANPSTMPFSLNASTDSSVLGQPSNLSTDVGYFIWFNDSENKWYFRWQANREDFTDVGDDGHTFAGTITSNGEIFDVVEPVGADGYELNEDTDLITSKTTSIEFSATIDCRENPGGLGSIDGGLFTDTDFICDVDGGTFLTTTFIGDVDGGFFTDTDFTPGGPDLALDGLTFRSGAFHYLFDMGDREDANRVSIFRDGLGYLNFRVLDNQATIDGQVNSYNLSTSIRDWAANSLHHIAVSWEFNSVDERDEMHLFVDGEEVPNLFKYGGYPSASGSFYFGDEAQETIIASSLKPIVGGFDGSTSSGSQLFISQGTNFIDEGVSVGDTLYILEDNLDGSSSLVGLGEGAYNITGVGENALTVDTSPNAGMQLTLGDITWSINQHSSTVDTAINFQDFDVYSVDTGGQETELNSYKSDTPDYTVERGDYGKHIININDGVSVGDKVILKPRGLIFRNCKHRVYTYDPNASEIRVNGPAPVSLQDVDITKIILPKELIADSSIYNSDFIDAYGVLTATFGLDGYYSYFSDGYLCQPSNQVIGRTLAIEVSSDNIDYTETNTVVINGETYPDTNGVVYESVTYNLTSNGIYITDEKWIRLDSIVVTITPVDIDEMAGVLEVREAKPINESDGNGDYVSIEDFNNGVFNLEIYGSGGLPFYVDRCLYEVKYPTFLQINVTSQPDTFFVGSDYSGANTFNGVIDEFRILDYASTDTRAGEVLASNERSVTSDYGQTDAFTADLDTLTLAHFDNNITLSNKFVDSFEEGIVVAPSVNSNFGKAIRVDGNRPYYISNASVVVNNNEGTIEFWVNPTKDAHEDPNRHYYVDMTSVITENKNSVSRISVVANQAVRSVDAVRLQSDINNTGVNYFTGGSVSNVDNKTITLGTPLPADNAAVKVIYTPLSRNGDRISIYKDEDGFVNFYIKASGTEYKVSSYIDWSRNTWHRIMVMWRANRTDNQDRIRLFVDGDERGTIKYGTGLLYGSGIVYGQADVSASRFVVSDINLTDTFSKIVVGADVLGVNGADARIDNLRFSSIERLTSISTIGGVPTDTTYIGNTSLAVPVVEDLYTTKLLNFDQVAREVTGFATLVNTGTGIFRFTVNVIDSFDKIGNNQVLKDLLVELIKTLAPAHTEPTVIFSE